MRRLARWLFALCSAVSLLLCIGVGLLWLRSYWVTYYTLLPAEDWEGMVLYSYRGNFYMQGTGGIDPATGQVYLRTAIPPMTLSHAVPFVAAAFLPSMYVAGVARRRHRARRLRAMVGLCPTCGYDLRASAERCPECGTAAAASVVPVDSPA